MAARRCSSGTGGATNGSRPRCRRSPARALPAQRIERRLVLKLARVFVTSSKALLSAHAPMVGRVTATAAGIVVRAVVSSKRAGSAVSDISGRVPASDIVVTIVTGVVYVSSSRSRHRHCCRRTTTKPPSSPVIRVTGSGDLQASAEGSAGVLGVWTMQISGRWATSNGIKAVQPRIDPSGAAGGPPEGSGDVSKGRKPRYRPRFK